MLCASARPTPYASYGTFLGDAGPGTPSQMPAYLDPAAKIAAEIYTSVQDPFQKVAVLEAQLQSAISKGASASRVRELSGKLAAARRAASLQMESEQSQREWSAVGKSAGVVAVGFGFVLTMAVLASMLGGKR